MSEKKTTQEPEPAKEEKKESKKKSSWPWGIPSTLGLTMAVFLLPQIFLSIFLSSDQIDRLAEGSDTALTFSVLVAGEIITFGLLLAIIRSKGKQLKDIFVTKARAVHILLAFPLFGLYLIASTVLFGISTLFLSNEVLEQEQDVGFNALNPSGMEQFLVFIGLVILVPFIEELLFRGYVLKGLSERIGWLWGAIASSALFGLAHLQLNVAIDTFALALVASWLVYLTRSIWPAVLLHAIKNCIAFAFLYEYITI